MTTIRTLACALVVSQSLAACNLIGPTDCTTDAWPAIVVEVRDAATRAPAAAGATGYVEDGDFREELNKHMGPIVDSLYMYGPFERAGTYTVVVDRPGYRRWSREGVRVRQGECHVRTERLRADLQSQP